MKYLIALMASLLFVSCQNKTQEEKPRDKELSANEGICIAEWKAGNKVMQLCFFDFTKAAHSNLLRIVIFRSDMLQSKQEADKQKKEEHAKANTDLI